MASVPKNLIHLLNEHEVAAMLGVSVATVRRWRLLRTGPVYIKIGASVRYAPESLAQFIGACPTGGGKEGQW